MTKFSHATLKLIAVLKLAVRDYGDLQAISIFQAPNINKLPIHKDTQTKIRSSLFQGSGQCSTADWTSFVVKLYKAGEIFFINKTLSYDEKVN